MHARRPRTPTGAPWHVFLARTCVLVARIFQFLSLRHDIPVFFRAPPVGAGGFLLHGQEKVTKEKATPRTRPEPIHGLRMRERPSGFAEGTSLCLRRTGPHPAGHPSDFSVARSPCSRGPVWRASCAHVPAKQMGWSCSGRGHGWPSSERQSRPCMTLRSAADHASKARMSEHREVRVRAGA